MPTNISSKSTIAKNTALLYGRTVLIMIVSLYTSRVILQALGVEDYGVYTAIGGVVSILSVVIAPIDSAISRFLTYELGRGDKDMLRRYFSMGLTVMLLFSLIAVIILETVGLWFLNNKMVIGEGRLGAANWVLHLSILTFIINMISSPYRATLIAHEKMNLFAYMGILDALLKLGVAFLIKVSTFDKLILYAFLMLLVSILIRFIYTVICNRNFEECHKPQFKIDKELFGGMFSFAGWSVFGAVAGVCRNQGVNILFNVFGGPVVNAAFGIANQVNGAVGSFVNNFTTSLNPSIIKSYASKQKEYMLSLVYQGAKYSYFLILIFALPLLLETEYVTRLWLGQTPDYSVSFIRIILLHSLIESFSKTIMAGTNATGNIRMYQLVVGGFQILILPIVFILLKNGFSPTIAFLSIVIVDFLALLARMLMASNIFGLSFVEFTRNVLIVSFLTTLLAIPVPFLVAYYMPQSLVRFVIVVLLCVMMTSSSILFVGCTRSERKAIIAKVKLIINRFVKKS